MLIDLLKSRRSIRQFTDKPVEQEKEDILIEAVLRSPSSRGLNPWKFIIVKNKKTIEQLSRAKAHGSAFMKNASLALVVCADPEKSDVWVEDASIASILLHLTAHDLGLGSCWVQIRRRNHDDAKKSGQYIGDLLGLDKKLEVEAIIAIGYPAETKTGHEKNQPLIR